MTGEKSAFELSLEELLGMKGRLLTAIRKELGLEPKEMADRLHVHPSTLNRYENGRITIPVALISDVKALLDEERRARNIQLVPANEQRPASAMTVTVDLARGPLPAGTKLVELVAPNAPESVTRMFAAVQGSEDGGARSGEGKSVVGVPSAATVGPRKRSGSEGTVARWGLAMAALSLLFVVPTGCMLARAGAGAKIERADGHCSEELSQGKVPSLWQGNGEKPRNPSETQQKSLKHYQGQKAAPCDASQGELEADKKCWWVLDPTRACPAGAVKDDGRCLVPVPARDKPISAPR